MRDAETYEQYANECERIARTMSGEQRKSLLAIAQAWRELARDAERRPVGRDRWWAGSVFVVVVRTPQRLCQFAPLASQVQPLIAEFAIWHCSGHPLAFQRSFDSNLHSPFH
jgi:hypothetical protein